MSNILPSGIGHVWSDECICKCSFAFCVYKGIIALLCTKVKLLHLTVWEKMRIGNHFHAVMFSVTVNYAVY